jgi:hypothetical protein
MATYFSLYLIDVDEVEFGRRALVPLKTPCSPDFCFDLSSSADFG